MIKNDAGLVAIVHWNPNPSEYTTPKHAVSLGWVNEDILSGLLTQRAKVCCGQTRQKYELANANQLSVWMTGHLP